MQQQVPVEPYQNKIKHTDFYTKLKTVLKKSQALQSYPKELEPENDK